MRTLNINGNLPPFCNFLHRNAWILCADAIILPSCIYNCFHHKHFSQPKCIKCRLLQAGFRQDQLGSLNAHLERLAVAGGIGGIKERKRKGKGEEGVKGGMKEREIKKERGSFAPTEVFKSWRL